MCPKIDTLHVWSRLISPPIQHLQSIFGLELANMDPPQQPATPSKQLSTLDLGVTPTKRPRDTTVDSSSPASVFDDCPSSEAFSIFGGSPPPRSTPSPLLRRQKSVAGRSLTAPPGKRAKRAGSSKKSKSLPFLPNELWDMVSCTLTSPVRPRN